VGLLDHFDRVQREEAHLRQAREWAPPARRPASGLLLAVLALLTR
jgi:hypothetical protein